MNKNLCTWKKKNKQKQNKTKKTWASPSNMTPPQGNFWNISRPCKRWRGERGYWWLSGYFSSMLIFPSLFGGSTTIQQCLSGSINKATEKLPLCSGSRTQAEPSNMHIASGGTTWPLKPTMGAESKMPGQLVFSIHHCLLLGPVYYVVSSQSSSGCDCATNSLDIIISFLPWEMMEAVLEQ